MIGDSGTGKTPGLGVTKRALASIERNRRDRIADLQRDHEGVPGDVDDELFCHGNLIRTLGAVAHGQLTRIR